MGNPRHEALYRERPLFSTVAAPIAEFRAWAKQFYQGHRGSILPHARPSRGDSGKQAS